MKVLIVRTFPDILNLNTYNVQEIGLAKALVCKGLECGVVLYHGKNADKEERISFSKDGKEYVYTIYWLRGIGFLKNGYMPSVYKLLPDYDVIQVHEYDQIMSWMLYSNPQKPTLIYHGPYYHPYARGYNLKCKMFDLLFFRWRKYDRVVALTKSELAADFLRQKGFCHVHAAGVGVDPDKFRIEEKEEVNCLLDRDKSRFRLLYVGKIEERRNVFFLVELFEKMQGKYENLQLVIVGDGEKEYVRTFLERIDKWIQKGKIVYFKKASQKELALLYSNVDLFVFTSNYEIFGMVLLEAMYFGLPVISSANGGASVLIRDGINGYMIKEFDARKWEHALEELLENRNLYERMRMAAHDIIEEHFFWDRLAEQFIAGYEEAAAYYETEGESLHISDK